MASTSNPLYTSPKLCKHLVDYKLRHGLSGYKSILKCLNSTPNGRTSIEKLGTKVPRCNSCNGYRGRLYLCLICSSLSCSSHTLSHTQLDFSHNIVVDLQRSELYCCLCGDQVYDPDFDRLVVSKTFMDTPNGSNVMVEDGLIRRSSKRMKLNSVMDLDLRKSRRFVSLWDAKAKSCYPLGLRGLNNLGNTCFMNSVLQVLLHAPPFRNYFLCERHDHDSCRKRHSGGLCLACDVDAVFSAVYSGDRTPFSPAQFLYSWWQHSVHLASYEQQDAHEFFISVLDAIHEKDGGERNHNKGSGDCQCIAHRAFSGMLRSDITCMTCGFTSTTYDPCVDISLDLETSSFPALNVGNKSTKPNGNQGKCSLSASLEFFTRPEKFGSDQKLYCRNCKEKRDSLKQMSFRRLPVVLSFHIKRFEHSMVRKMSRKIDWHLQFPFSLDMTPYLSSSIIRTRFGNRIYAFESDEVDASPEFEIFAVVSHSGMLESGHYVTYLRLRNQWYKCDDAWITEVDEYTVRASQCYMIFYVQKMLYYRSSEDLSCTSVSLRRDPFVPVAGCC